METELVQLLAREAIRDLPLRYCDCVWRDDIDGIIELFAADGSFTAIFDGREATVSGREALRGFFESGLAIEPRPYIHNHVVELVGENFATGRCYLDLRSARRNMEFIGAGYYNDEYIATPQGWKFQSRRFVAVRIDDIPEGVVD